MKISFGRVWNRCRWTEEWQLTVSIDKCSVLYIGKSVITVEVFNDGTRLPFVTSCRDLGVTISAHLTPSVHVNNIVRVSLGVYR